MKKDEKEVVIKKRIKVTNVLIVLLLMYVVGFYSYKFLVAPINNIYISGNNYLSDQEVIDISGIRNYPSFILTFKYKIKNNLLENVMVEEVKIKKKMGRVVYINVKESTPLFIYNEKTILSDGNQVSNMNYSLPILRGMLDKVMLNKLVDKYQSINDEIRLMISEIEYVPNDIDKERFLLTMNDGNYVYITLYKTTSINEYIKIISKEDIKDKKGILYLDSGNYFETLK